MASAGVGEIKRLRSALTIQGRVIWALVLREMRTRFGHSRIGYAWALGEPMVYILILTALKGYVRGGSSALGESSAVFFFTGVIPFLFFRRIASQVGNAISANQALLNYPPVRPIDTIIARTVLEFATMLIVALLIGILFAMLDLPIVPDDPLRFLGAFLAAALIGLSFGVFSAAISGVFQAWTTIMSWILLAHVFLSGKLFVVDFMPPAVREWLAWIPLVHVIALARSAQYPGYESQIVDMGYVVTCGLALLAIGLLAERAFRRRSEE